jgi:NAD(P)-dependent dehydrogenase (short-subunit alcohol dehydrogenase family)
VVVAGRTEAKLKETCAEISRRGSKALPVVCDVGYAAQIQSCVDATVGHFGTVDILVNNAQSVPLGRLIEVTDEAFEEGWTTGPLATLRFMRACYPHLKGGGSIVNLGTGAGLRSDPVGLGAYAAVKEATRTLTRAAAYEWGPDNIRVNVIIPLANSPAMAAWSEARPEESRAFMATVPLGRCGDPEQDIGRAVLMLVGPDGSYITGSTLMLDGGQAYLR